ncbi:MAG: S24 family peptidase [Gammaproteobacteria bacterium]|nr:S24 family peptidase [Gammaproteobacteria bacterium]MXZ28122.1 S24 family peptidase [Gammaproteobacteria bacterium]MYF58809.1 S24 family peptidase [Gammaproteobacteria bacterium]
MQNDPVRQKIRDLLWERGLNMREASLAIGRNVSYVHGFLERNTPKVLSHLDAEKLAEVLECGVEDLRHAERPPTRKGRGRKPRGYRAPEGSPVPLATLREVEVEASAGPGALADEFVSEKALWFLPEGMIRYEGGAVPDAVRVLRVRGESMEPELSEGDRLLVDTSKRVPATGEMFVLWDGNGLVVKRVERVDGTGGEPGLRLKSTNADYADYTAPAGDVHVVGKVLWTVRKV